MGVEGWFLSASERGNPATSLDSRRGDGLAWSSGNLVQPLVHGKAYFAELLRCVRSMRAGDFVFFTDWRGDPDEQLDGPGSEISQVLSDAAARGVVVKGLIWRSHMDKLAFSEEQNRHLGEQIESAGGECLLDMRVRTGGSHHQKFVVLRHPGRPDLDVAFVGGIDLCHSRRDSSDHHGDSQPQPFAGVYGPRPPWHDIQLALRGPAVDDVETVFRERWDDPQPLTRNPVNRLSEMVRGTDHHAGRLPARVPDLAPRGSAMVQVLRTYPALGARRAYPFAPRGERSVARAYAKVVERAHSLIYLEDQYLWSTEVAGFFARALESSPSLHLIAVVPHHPDQDGRLSLPLNLVGRQQALDELSAAGGDRVAVYGIENRVGTPVYVHAKVCVVDDVWASVGSDNVNRRSWTHDSELSCAVLDTRLDPREPRSIDRHGDGARVFARDLRLQLSREHLDADDDADLIDPHSAFRAFARSAQRLQKWYEHGRRNDRPAGRLRPYVAPDLSPVTRAWATPLYHALVDPDGRPGDLRRSHTF